MLVRLFLCLSHIVPPSRWNGCFCYMQFGQKSPLMLGKLSSRRFTIVLKRRQEASKKSQLSRIQRSQQMELKLKLI
ncbi:hypothetical protein Gotur_029353 [Gossypium turneri]